MSTSDRTDRPWLALPRFDVFSPAWNAALALLLFVGVKSFLVVTGFSRFRFGDFDSAALVWSQVLLFLLAGFLFFLMSSRIRVGRLYDISDRVLEGSRFQGRTVEARFPLLRALLLVLIVLILHEIFFRLIGYSLFTSEAGQPLDVKLAFGRSPMGFVLLKAFADTLLRVATLFLAFQVVVFRRNWLEFGLLVLVAGYLSLFTGSRGLLFWVAVVPAVLMYNCFRRRITIWEVLLLAPLALLAFGALDIIRHAEGTSLFESMAVVSNLDWGAAFLLAVERRIDSFFPNLLLLMENWDRFGFRWGGDYIGMIGQHLPRSVFPNKPLSFVRIFNRTLQIQTAGGTGIAALGEAWANFGPVGVGLAGALAGMVVATTQRVYSRSLREGNVAVLVAVVTIGYMFVQRLVISPGLTHNAVELTFRTFYVVLSIHIVRVLFFPSVEQPARLSRQETG